MCLASWPGCLQQAAASNVVRSIGITIVGKAIAVAASGIIGSALL
jgi:hypothetical protein